MKLNDTTLEFEGNLPANRSTFQIQSSAKLFGILSDGIYADKIAAVIRELSCNAYDSHIASNQTKPFFVNVPTRLDPVFSVEDFGTGIDPEKITEIFWTYGSSTKTNSNDQIGALGLGSKSPFAYTKSSFIVRNRYQGTEYTYFCFINESGIPDGSLVSSVMTAEPNGIKVELAVRTDDIQSFNTRIIRFFSFWKKGVPEFSDDRIITKIQEFRKKYLVLEDANWELFSGNYDQQIVDQAYVVMGNVPYPISIKSIPNPSKDLIDLCKARIAINVPIGSVAFQASREELSYETLTIKTLEESALEVRKSILDHTISKLQNLDTPYQLMNEYETILDDMYLFPTLRPILQSSEYILKDGRKFIGTSLAREKIFSMKKKSKFNVKLLNSFHRNSVRGMTYYSPCQSLQVTMNCVVDKIDHVTSLITQETLKTQCDWYQGKLKPVTFSNNNRIRTPANLLYDKFFPVETNLHVSNSNISFIINDLGDDGTNDVRFIPANPKLTYYFINGDENVSLQEVISEFNEFIKDTSYEGIGFTYLSKIKGFIPPDKKKYDKKERNPIDKGTVEVIVTKFNTKSLTTQSDTIRHDITKPLLYVSTSYGTPTSELLKSLINTSTLARFFSLGYLNDFVNDELAIIARLNATNVLNNDELVIVARLNATNVLDLQKKNVTLISIESLLSKLETEILADVEFQKMYLLHNEYSRNLPSFLTNLVIDDQTTEIYNVVKSLTEFELNHRYMVYKSLIDDYVNYFKTYKKPITTKEKTFDNTYPLFIPISGGLNSWMSNQTKKKIYIELSNYVNYVNLKMKTEREEKIRNDLMKHVIKEDEEILFSNLS